MIKSINGGTNVVPEIFVPEMERALWQN